MHAREPPPRLTGGEEERSGRQAGAQAGEPAPPAYLMYWGLREGGRSLMSFSAFSVSFTTSVTRKRAVEALNLTLSLLRLILIALVCLLLTSVRNSLMSWICFGYTSTSR